MHLVRGIHLKKGCLEQTTRVQNKAYGIYLIADKLFHSFGVMAGSLPSMYSNIQSNEERIQSEWYPCGITNL